MADTTENSAGNIGPTPADATPYVSKAGHLLTPRQVAALKNLKRPPKGVRPPHLTGRPKGTTILSALVKRLDEPVRKLFDPEFLKSGKLPKTVANRRLAQALGDVMLKEALKGNFTFLKEILDRCYGPVAQRLAGHDGGPLKGEVAQGQLNIMMTNPKIQLAAMELGELLAEAEQQSTVPALPAPAETDEHQTPIPPGEH